MRVSRSTSQLVTSGASTITCIALPKTPQRKTSTAGTGFPVRVKGVDSNVLAFHAEFIKRCGVVPTITRFSAGVGELEFTYVGSDGPETVENLAIKHRLTILQCGNRFTT